MRGDNTEHSEVFDLLSEAGFRRFVSACRPQALGFLMRDGVPGRDAEDLCQGALVVVWRRRREVSGPKAFLIGAAKRLAAEHRRKAALAVSTIPLESLSSPPADRAKSASIVPARAARRVERLLGLLPNRQRQVIQLVWLRGFSRQEAACRLGISQSTLRVQEKRGFDAMKQRVRRVRP